MWEILNGYLVSEKHVCDNGISDFRFTIHNYCLFQNKSDANIYIFFLILLRLLYSLPLRICICTVTWISVWGREQE